MIGHASYIIPSTLYEMFKGQAGVSADQSPCAGNHGESAETWRSQDPPGSQPFS